MKLTAKQEAFCRAYMELGNASEAYRQAYSAGKMSADAIHVEASKLLDNPKLTLRLSELQDKALERHIVTVDDLIAELEEARVMAATGERAQPAAMVSATMGKAKLLGFLTDKVAVTGANGGPVQSANMTPDQFKEIAKQISSEI